MNAHKILDDTRAKQWRGESLFPSYDTELKIAKAFATQCNKNITMCWQNFIAKIPVPNHEIVLSLSAWIREMENGEYRVYMFQLESPDKEIGDKMVKMKNYGLIFNEQGIGLSFVS